MTLIAYSTGSNFFSLSFYFYFKILFFFQQKKGARMVFQCLLELSKYEEKGKGIVYDVLLLGKLFFKK